MNRKKENYNLEYTTITKHYTQNIAPGLRHTHPWRGALYNYWSMAL